MPLNALLGDEANALTKTDHYVGVDGRYDYRADYRVQPALHRSWWPILPPRRSPITLPEQTLDQIANQQPIGKTDARDLQTDPRRQRFFWCTI